MIASRAESVRRDLPLFPPLPPSLRRHVRCVFRLECLSFRRKEPRVIQSHIITETLSLFLRMNYTLVASHLRMNSLISEVNQFLVGVWHNCIISLVSRHQETLRSALRRSLPHPDRAMQAATEEEFTDVTMVKTGTSRTGHTMLLCH